MTLGVDNSKRIEMEFNTSMFMSDMRLKSGLTSLRDVAAVVGVSAATLSRIDRGQVPDMTTFMQVCAVLQMQPGNYFDVVVWERKLATE